MNIIGETRDAEIAKAICGIICRSIPQSHAAGLIGISPSALTAVLRGQTYVAVTGYSRVWSIDGIERNCPKHPEQTKTFGRRGRRGSSMLVELQERIQQLETENAELRSLLE